MTRRFEFFVALRYLRARRKQAVIGIITVISIIGVAAGVMALIIALAINNGFRNTLENSLLRATAHVMILERDPGYGIAGWQAIQQKLEKLPGVKEVSPALYAPVFITGPTNSDAALIKGIDPSLPLPDNHVLRTLEEGSIDKLAKGSDGRYGIILGSVLAHQTGMVPDSIVTIISPQGQLTPMGLRPATFYFRVAGIFDSGSYQLDSRMAFTSLEAAQMVMSVPDVVNSIELQLDDLNDAPRVAEEASGVIGDNLVASTWMEQNQDLMAAFHMERIATVVTIGLIQLVAALNILITLIMMVMEKHRDIALLMSMGTRREQIRNIFICQGVLIGVIGSAIGLVLGYGLSFLADHYHLLSLPGNVYDLSYVPFEPRWIDALWVPAAAILVSFLATIYPARSATRIAPAEALRYE